MKTVMCNVIITRVNYEDDDDVQHTTDEALFTLLPYLCVCVYLRYHI